MNMRKKSVFLVLLAILLVISLVLPVLTAFSYVSIHKAYVADEERLISGMGDVAGEQFGASLASGDVNGDGVEDLLVGSPYYSTGDITWARKVSVYFGKTGDDNGLSGVSLGAPDLNFYGRNEGSHLGISVSTGDFNDDGYADILMGAYRDLSNNENVGRAYLMLGRDSYKKVDHYFSRQEANFEFVGKGDGDGFGISVQLVDINDDNFDDVLVGAPFAVSIEDVSAGNVYAYFGKGYRVDRVYFNNKMFYDRDADAVFWGQEDGERFGASMTALDFVGGEGVDIAIGAYFGDGPNGPQSGKVYVYKGPAGNMKNFYTPYDILVSDEPYSWFGFSVDALELGGVKSLFVSAFSYASSSLRGKAYLFEPREWFVNPFAEEDEVVEVIEDVVEVSEVTEVVDVEEEESEFSEFFVVNEFNSDYYFEGDDSQNLLGASHGVGDFDADGLNDLFVGAPGVSYTSSQEAGEVYFFYGEMLAHSRSFYLDEKSVTGIVAGDRPDDWFGARAASLDFNGDGFDDIAISSRYADGFDEEGLVAGSDYGEVYVLLGGEDFWGTEISVKQASDASISRGEFINSVVERFEIKDTRKSYLDSCYTHRDFCFYVFSSQSKFEGITLDPEIILYPDVPVDSEYYDAITMASMLGVVSGYAGDEDTPFRPDDSITRIQALKVVLGINQLVKPLYRFELINHLGGVKALESQKSMFPDISPKVTSMWWYPMYANFAYEHELVDASQPFRPDDYLTKGELNDMIDRTLEFINNQ